MRVPEQARGGSRKRETSRVLVTSACAHQGQHMWSAPKEERTILLRTSTAEEWWYGVGRYEWRLVVKCFQPARVATVGVLLPSSYQNVRIHNFLKLSHRLLGVDNSAKEGPKARKP